MNGIEHTLGLNVEGELENIPCYFALNCNKYCHGESDGNVGLYLLNEHPFSIYVNGSLYSNLVCTPRDLTSLAVGNLLSGGAITTIEDIVSIKYNTDNTKCEVCTRGISGKKKENTEFTFWKPEWVISLAKNFQNDTELHILTQGTHSCFLAKNGEILIQCEDIGRHNALDKTIGRSALLEIPEKECVLYISGRLPLDMLKKVINANFSVIVSNTVPTKQSIELALEKRVTIIGRARGENFIVYADKGKDVAQWH